MANPGGACVRCSNGDAERGSACNAPRSPATALLLPHFEIIDPLGGDPEGRTPTCSAPSVDNAESLAKALLLLHVEF